MTEWIPGKDGAERLTSVSLPPSQAELDRLAQRKGNVFDPVVHNIVLRTVLYYVALFALGWWLDKQPWLNGAIRGSLDGLSANGLADFTGLSKAKVAEQINESVQGQNLSLMTGVAMLGSVLLALPVAWIYTLTRKKRGYDQSVVQTLILLPALVSGVVVLVKYSLALAFSLTGIVAAVRFRSSLDDTKDAIYIFLATTIGIASGVQLPMAAVLSIIFNCIMLVLWYSDFGKTPPAMEGMKAQRRLEEARARLRQTGSFVAMLDDEIFADMTPEQLDLAADHAWRRKRRFETDDVSDEDMQKKEVLLRIRCKDVEEMRGPVEALFPDYLKKWRFGGVVKEADGTKTVEYAVQIKKSVRGADLADALHAKSQVLDVDIK
jgi:hypothetical protein